MRYWPTGPYELTREGDTLLEFDAPSRKLWWDEIDERTTGLSYGCGIYLFAIRFGKVAKPWYVGKAEKQNFRERAISKDKIDKFEGVVRSVKKGVPMMYFYARLTGQKLDYSRPSTRGYRDIRFLEKMLIGHALQRNPDLLNVQETALLSNMMVPGLLNTGRGVLASEARDLKAVLGY